MPVKINLGKKEQPNKVESTEEQQELALTLEEQLVALIGTENIDKAAHLYNQMEDLKTQLSALESDYKPIASAIQTTLEDADLAPTKKLVLKSETGVTMTVAAKRKSTKVTDKEALYHALEETKEGLFFELSNVGLTDAKSYVPVKGNVGTIYTETYGKTRTLGFKM